MKRNGFTLVEILVVMAVIGILSAFLYPVFARAKARAHQVTCINNLKQLAEAIQLYEQDYDGMAMPVRISMHAEWGYMWQDLVDKYIRQLKGIGGLNIDEQGQIFMCPSAPLGTAIYGYKAAKTYGYNVYINITTHEEQIEYPSKTLRLTECSDRDPDDPYAVYGGGSWYAPMPDVTLWHGQFDIYAPGWHDGKNTVLWVDGHVDSMSRKEVMKTDDNSDPNYWCRLKPK
ncbi:MAG TPA: prepilin-type N-terminal cleavage/methylation domain-containing protein [Armatimonadota bacterium]|nr:prepilin-type N-terminal cleavage/methylation domain-containing protein [Armatimonadota bacterium]